MSDPIFTKSFSQTKRNRIGYHATLLCFIILMSISSSLKTYLHLHPMSLIGDDLKMVIADDGIIANNRTIGGGNPTGYVQLSRDAAEDKLIASATLSTYFDNARCASSSNYCEIDGETRVEANSSTIYILVRAPRESISSSNSTNSWIADPSPRKGIRESVKKWRVTLVPHKQNEDIYNVPKCSEYHNHPAILFSLRGLAGNYYHDFADVLFPLYLTSSELQGEVQFLVTNHKRWWIRKYTHILNKLTKHNILDIDGETLQVHCYNQIRIGVKFHKSNELRSLPFPPLSKSPSMPAFRELLREAYSLKRASVRDGAEAEAAPPRLMIIDRKRTRVLTNTRQVSRAAAEMGFEVVAAAEMQANMTAAAEAVNSCDVLVGVHGAGLTNMVFLPDGAVVIQVVPSGNIDVMARIDYENPTAGMNLRYLRYKITAEESSLSRKYSRDHRILRNPESYRTWKEVARVYLNQQNVTVDLRRFKGTLLEALKLLRH